MENDSVKKLTIIGVIWSFVEKFMGYFIQFIFTIVLARLLTPEDFGLVGLLIVFTSISQVFIESGFSQALIQDNKSDIKHYSTVFYFNIGLSIILYLLLFISSPLIANFYNDQRLVNISRFVFLSLIINSLSIVPNTILQKEMNFKILAKRTLLANILSGVISIFLAYKGFGVWSLVIQTLLANLFKTSILWYSIKWRPIKYFSLTYIKKIYKFSVNIMLSSLLDTLVSNTHILIIGKFYNKTTLGFFSQSYNLQSIPANALVSVVRSVTFPAMSKLQDDENELVKYFKNSQNYAFFIVFNLFVLLSILSSEIVKLFLGEKWLESIDYFKLLCFVGAFLPVYNLGMNVLLVKKQGKLYLYTNIIKRVITLVCVLVTIKFGILTLIYGQIIAVIFNSLVTMYATSKVINLSIFDQIKDLYKSLVVGIICLISIMYLNTFINFEDILNMILKSILFGIILLTTSILINHPIIKIFKNKLKLR